MKKTTRTIKPIISFLLTFCILFSMCSLSGTFAVSAIIPESISSDDLTEAEKVELDVYKTTIKDLVEPIFGKRQINSCEYIYNLDDSADYICVTFEGGGYVIYAKGTMEMLEYNLEGSLPYDETTSKKYYAGPTNYLQKENDQFCNMISGEKITLSKVEIQNFSQQARASITNQAVAKYDAKSIDFSLSTKETTVLDNTTARSSIPSYDEHNLIIASNLKFEHIIPNYQFFTANPTIGDNDGTLVANQNWNTCGPVAAQLLLGYVNYFHDRRIIPDRFLNGYNDSTSTIAYTGRNPNTCLDPMSMDSNTTGTRSSNDGVNSFYLEMVQRIMEPNSEGCTLEELYDGIVSYLLTTDLTSYEYAIAYDEAGWFFGYDPIDSTPIKAEIDAGRPLIISMDDNLNGTDHCVVAYGYQSYQYPGGSDEYDGYIVHLGYTIDTQVWINSAWCDGYLTLNVSHTHNYQKIGAIGSTSRVEYKCNYCNHRTDAVFVMETYDRYAEQVVALYGEQSKDYYLYFKGEGVKLIQTFGSKNTMLELYDLQDNLIASSENDGFQGNALISYYLYAYTGYILRVTSHSSYSYPNKFKVAIMPAYGVSAANSYITDFEDIYSVTNTLHYTLHSFTQLGYVRVIAFTPQATANFTITIESDFDTFVYAINPASEAPIVSGVNYDDDGGEDANPSLTAYMYAQVPFLIIFSAYAPSSLSDVGDITLKIDLKKS